MLHESEEATVRCLYGTDRVILRNLREGAETFMVALRPVCSCSLSISGPLPFPIQAVPLTAESNTEARGVDGSGQSSPGLRSVYREGLRWGWQ